jgi:hypothetical protein
MNNLPSEIPAMEKFPARRSFRNLFGRPLFRHLTVVKRQLFGTVADFVQTGNAAVLSGRRSR